MWRITLDIVLKALDLFKTSRRITMEKNGGYEPNELLSYYPFFLNYHMGNYAIKACSKDMLKHILTKFDGP
jgi:hypothetical protein